MTGCVWATEENRPWWGVRTSNPGGAARLSQVGSTPILFRQHPREYGRCLAQRDPVSQAEGLAGATRTDQQQWVRRVPRPACLADEKIKPERRKVVGEWVHLHVLGLVQNF